MGRKMPTEAPIVHWISLLHAEGCLEGCDASPRQKSDWRILHGGICGLEWNSSNFRLQEGLMKLPNCLDRWIMNHDWWILCLFTHLPIVWVISCLLFLLTRKTKLFWRKEGIDPSFVSDAGMRPSDHDTNQGRKSCAIEHHLEMGWNFIWLDLLNPDFRRLGNEFTRSIESQNDCN